MHDVEKARHAASFGGAAAAYERGRPPYPSEALDWLLPATARRVLDLGAGTGKLTRQLVERGLDVVAVDPSEGMLAELRRSSPAVTAHLGTAEALPVDGGAFDAVLVAQAWHWVDPGRAVPEVARVLEPGGRLGLLWNRRDETAGWMRDLGRILSGFGFSEESSDDPPIGPPFGAPERHDVRWSHRVTAATLLDLVASRSYVIVMEPTGREDVLGKVRDLIAREPGFADGGEVAMPYVTRCFRTHRP